MLKRLRLKGFKNFEDAELSMGPFTLLVGANASGKSNVREALRFLHALGRGYTLVEIFGGKYSAGERQWDGMRGGLPEVSFRGAGRFSIEVDSDLSFYNNGDRDPGSTLSYSIEVSHNGLATLPVVRCESLWLVNGDGSRHPIYESLTHDEGGESLSVHHCTEDPYVEQRITSSFSAHRPVLLQLTNKFLPSLQLGDPPPKELSTYLVSIVHDLSYLRFPEFSLDAMRNPSAPGQGLLSDRGENLSSVLQTICNHEPAKQQLIEWLRLLTPVDVSDLRFEPDVRGQIVLMLVEQDGRAFSVYSASDGTLRFLGMLAALLPTVPGLVFFEEIETGLHPTRLRLLVDLLRSRSKGTKTPEQIVSTSHSPMLLSLLDEQMLSQVSLVYRLEGQPSAHITRLLDVPDAARVLATHNPADLLASGWFEDMVEFAAAPAEPIQRASGEEANA